MAEAYQKVYQQQMDEALPAVLAKGAALLGKGSKAAKLAGGANKMSMAADAAGSVAKSAKNALTSAAKNTSSTGTSTSGMKEAAVLPVRPVVAVKRNTTLNLEINPETKGPGEVTQAYYTFPAGFDPINRQDVTYGGDKKAQNEEVEDIELVGDYLIENGYVSTYEAVDAFYQHMSPEWREELAEKMSCWKGYKRVSGKAPGEPGSCTKA